MSSDQERILLRLRKESIVEDGDDTLLLDLSGDAAATLRDRLNARIDAEVLGDVDAWGLRENAGWYFFGANMPGASGARGYRRKLSGGDVIAETPGPVLGVLSIGGARRALAYPGRGDFPYHVVAPLDEVGAVGLAGIEAAEPTGDAQLLREQSSDSMLAHEILRLRQSAGAALPLIVARTETDRSASITELAEGMAFRNLLQAVENLNALAGNLGKKAKIASISVDFGSEDVMSDNGQYVAGFQDLLKKLEKALWRLGHAPPVFLSVFETTKEGWATGQLELSLRPTGHRLVYAAPSYALETDEFARLTQKGMAERARIEAAALSALENGTGWQCPTFLLAEWEGAKPWIRVRSNSLTPLVVDQADPFRAGGQSGFVMHGPDGEVQIRRVKLDRKDPRDIMLKLPDDAPRKGLVLSYAWGQPGAIRDDWAHPGGETVRRWALPARLEVHG